MAAEKATISPEFAKQRGREVRAWTDHYRGAGREGLSSGVPAYGMGSSEIDDAAMRFNMKVDAAIGAVSSFVGRAAGGVRSFGERVARALNPKRPL